MQKEREGVGEIDEKIEGWMVNLINHGFRSILIFKQAVIILIAKD